VTERAAAGARIRKLLDHHRRAGGRDAALLLHSESGGAVAIAALVQAARVDAGLQGLPPRVLPLAVPAITTIGLELWLAAFACGAAQVWVLVTHEDEPPEREAIAMQMRVGQAVLASLGLAGEHLRIIGGGEVSRLAMDTADATAALMRLDRALQRPAAATVAEPATFALGADRRETFRRAVAHLRARAGLAPDSVALRAALADASRLIDETAP
jgi:hypothetical protein